MYGSQSVWGRLLGCLHERTRKTGSSSMGQDSTPQSILEAYYLCMAACWCYSFTCQHAELGVHRNPPRAAVWIHSSWVIYLLSGIGGSILSSLFIQRSISVGASGALFGLLGAMLSELFTNWTIYTNKAAAVFTLIVIIAINLAVGILPHVDNFAHIGGFLTGFLLGFVLLVRPSLVGWKAGIVRLLLG
ncbi:UNVERIFIED_CONTAM: RHOMBOID-like protein 2 [Sesamum angustifolium]|uniref:RHOMBOID-like protein n=1 Tax=Sesamum angustifolium TaxID=2727405 RepID=A0AAW2KR53_9LAMI